MTLEDLRTAIRQLQSTLITCKRLDLDPYAAAKKSAIDDFKNQQKESAQASFFSALRNTYKAAGRTEADISTLQRLNTLSTELQQSTTLQSCKNSLDKLSALVATLKTTPTTLPELNTTHLPTDIQDEVLADIKEAHKCYNSGCYRSTVILCGRLLENALHRKYYEITGNDLLEKSPGIGLGNLVAKITEKNITLDPGLSNQIHLINQIRIFSVHKKNTPFTPSQDQAHAIYLYTLDIFKKLFP